MTWEWVGAVTTGTVGLAGIVATYRGGKRQVDAQMALAREERQQTRLERTYHELAIYVHRRRKEASEVRPPLGRAADAPPPVPVTQEEIERVEALVETNASKAVQDIIGEFAAQIEDISTADTLLKLIERAPSAPDAEPGTSGATRNDFLKRIHDGQHQLVRTEDRLHAQMRKELGTDR